jgi:hypothetical protein
MLKAVFVQLIVGWCATVTAIGLCSLGLFEWNWKFREQDCGLTLYNICTLNQP